MESDHGEAHEEEGCLVTSHKQQKADSKGEDVAKHKRMIRYRLRFGNPVEPSPRARIPPLPRALELHASSEVLNRIWAVIESWKTADPSVSHSTRLLAKGNGADRSKAR
jgi:hypothetical protein